jgi:GNAT superfamily N-acetyltransferase
MKIIQVSWKEFFPKCLPLWKEHWEELGEKQIPFNPDVSFYQVLDQSGCLVILTARKEERIVGYYLFILQPYVHSKGLLFAFEHMFFLTKELRKGWNGVRLMREAAKIAKERGAVCFRANTPNKPRITKLMQSLGFVADGQCFSKWI